jgi:hypothetical protein
LKRKKINCKFAFIDLTKSGSRTGESALGFNESGTTQRNRKQCCGSGIRCLFDPWIRDPGWAKISRSGSGMNISDHISESLETVFFGGKYINSLMRIRIRNTAPMNTVIFFLIATKICSCIMERTGQFVPLFFLPIPLSHVRERKCNPFSGWV